MRVLRFAACLIITSLAAHAGVASDLDAARAVGEVLDRLHESASTADGETYFSLYTEDAVFMGTDLSERWTLDEFKAFAQPYFDSGRGWTYEVRERHVGFSHDGATAWFDEVLWNEHYGNCRGSGVLVNDGEAWRISQYSLTIPIPNDIAGDVVRQIRACEAGEDASRAGEALVVILVRHAEMVDSSTDAPLSSAGEQRALELDEMLRDAGVQHIHSSDYLRSRATVAPLAQRLGLDIEPYDPNRQQTLVELLRTTGGRHLVVGHSNTIPELVELLGGDPGSAVDSRLEYDQMYVVTATGDDSVETMRLRYGRPVERANEHD